MFVIDIVEMLVRHNHGLKKQLHMAHLPYDAHSFVRRSLMTSLYLSVTLSFILFMIVIRFGFSPLFLLAFFPLSFFGAYFFFMQTPTGYIRKRRNEIDKDVLFAGRYLLVKLDSGEPLFNSMIDASKGYGVCGAYFKEIVDEINTGTAIEDALEKAREDNASAKFKKVLWQMVASLKTGTDVSSILKSTLRAITAEQVIEIKEYGKKLNSLMLFYMVAACVFPSLGVAMFIILSSFINLTFTTTHFILIILFLVLVQVIFITVIKSIRPAVNL